MQNIVCNTKSIIFVTVITIPCKTIRKKKKITKKRSCKRSWSFFTTSHGKPKHGVCHHMLFSNFPFIINYSLNIEYLFLIICSNGFQKDNPSEPRKTNPAYFPLYRLFNRDPYVMVYCNPNKLGSIIGLKHVCFHPSPLEAWHWKSSHPQRPLQPKHPARCNSIAKPLWAKFSGSVAYGSCL